MRINQILPLVITTVLLATPAQASIKFVTTRANLGGNAWVDWSSVAPAYTSVPNPFSVNITSVQKVTVSKAGSPFSRTEQGTYSDAPFAGNFAANDALIATGNYGDSTVMIKFTSPVMGAGVQIESYSDGPYKATIEAFDKYGNCLGSFGTSGLANYGYGADNTAPFIGILSDSANITSIRINGERTKGTGFAFNKLSVKY
jgi:hypothetical protein